MPDKTVFIIDKPVKRSIWDRLVTFELQILIIAMTRFVILWASFIVLGQTASAQSSFPSKPAKNVQNCKPPLTRELFHDYVDAQQKNILKSDGKNDNLFAPSANEEVNFALTQAATTKIDALQCVIETDSTLNDQVKKKYLKGVEYMLKFFVSNTAYKRVSQLILPDIITAYEKCMQKDKQGLSIEGIITALSYEAGYSVIRADNVTFEKNPGYKAGQQVVVLKYCVLHPDKTFSILRDNPDMPFADSLIKTIAKKYTKQLYDYAQANNKLGAVIRNITGDSFVKAVVTMAKSKDGQQYFCFLDNIVKGKLTYEEIDAAKEDSVLYYRLLVKTQMDYVTRALDKDTAFEFATLAKRLENKAKENFVNTINGLHTETAEVRFRCIQNLTAEELYYLAVSSDGSIYTSSFVKGVYPLMMKKINNRGDSLLLSLHFDKYRKLIKMSAGYNTLGNFLGTFPKSSNSSQEDPANMLMKAFVKNLEKAEGLEDGVDVADSYASIADTLGLVANEMLKNIQDNYQRNASQGNKRGMAIYNILYKLFLSADTTKGIDLTKELGIPPVYEMPYKSLVNDSGKVVMQVFFYGDKDGQGIFKGFVNMFSNTNWKTTSTDKWVCMSSVKGKPVSIYANKPLPEEGGEDEAAQKELCEYLEKNKFYPSITIHRGHSYYADATIEQMFPSSKIVFLGSCGGYHLIHDVLEKAPDAHIIASKQIGATEVNRPFFQLLTEKIRNGNNIDWIPFWKELDKMVVAKEFEDYIPPYKNLGALFIKAYKIAMGEEN
jgi:hypothetical protein